MDELLLAYIDSFEHITVLVNKKLDVSNKSFYLIDNKKKTKLDILNFYEEEKTYKYILRFIPSIRLNKDYKIIDELKNETSLKSGSVIRTQEFDSIFNYKGPLGVEYSKDKTIFRIWSPVAKDIFVRVVKKHKVVRYRLNYIDKGLWQAEIKGDLLDNKYLYEVRVFDEFVELNDPYALASDLNGKYNYIIDIDKCYTMQHKKPKFSGKATDAIIYEASIRDFTCGIDNVNRGTFLGMLDDKIDYSNEVRGLNYIKSLGITHLQLLPTYDFGDVDDINKDLKYNWGYNPEQYFIPCGWYSIDPEDPYSRINELKQLIDECHKNGILVIMDVVFNHVFKSEFFAFENLVPGYFFRIEADGSFSNASGCGNVIATERNMARKFIVDVLKYYAKYYSISGFRFDLMGLIDVDTLNEAYDELMDIDKKTIVFGEGWNMDNPLPDEKRAHMYNHQLVPKYGFFNDRFRDYIRGGQWNKTPGYSFGANRNVYDLENLIKGSCLNYYKFDEPTQSINYVECHDNFTFYDYAVYYLGLDKKNAKDAARLALEIVLISEGVAFIHAGEEFFRTKYGVENSYNSPDKINKIDYQRRNKYISNVNAIRDLINIRKEYSVFRLSNHKEIENRIHILDGITNNNCAGFLYQGKDYNLIVYIKNNYAQSEIKLHNYEMIYDKGKCSKIKNKYTFKSPGVYIFKEVK